MSEERAAYVLPPSAELVIGSDAYQALYRKLKAMEGQNAQLKQLVRDLDELIDELLPPFILQNKWRQALKERRKELLSE